MCIDFKKDYLEVSVFICIGIHVLTCWPAYSPIHNIPAGQILKRNLSKHFMDFDY